MEALACLYLAWSKRFATGKKLNSADWFPLLSQVSLKKFSSKHYARLLSLAVALTVLSIANNAVARTLQVGNRGEDVASLQDQLRTLGYFHDETTGYFGLVTKEAVQQFQSEYGLEATGIVNSDTQNALQNRYRPSATSYSTQQSNFSQGNFNSQPAPSIISYSPNDYVTSAYTCRTPVYEQRKSHYIVVVPKASNQTLWKVRQVYSVACLAKSRLGDYIRAGFYTDRGVAENVSQRLRKYGLKDARVVYRP